MVTAMDEPEAKEPPAMQPAPASDPDTQSRPADGDPGFREIEALVARAQRGDVAAFEEIYRRHVGRVHALCLRLTGEDGQAEALTQDVFVRAWRKLPLFAGRSAIGTWLHRLTVNLFIQGQRAEARRTQRVVAVEDLTPWDRARPDAPPGLAMDLESAVAGLPPGARLVFVLHDVEGYRHEEIAALTGVSVGTSKAQLHRARRLLREALR